MSGPLPRNQDHKAHPGKQGAVVMVPKFPKQVVEGELKKAGAFSKVVDAEMKKIYAQHIHDHLIHSASIKIWDDLTQGVPHE